VDIHDPTKSILWPPELSSPLKPNATHYEVAKSNYVLDFHGNPNEPDLVIFMAGNQSYDRNLCMTSIERVAYS
jgi:hypothetical protein